MDSRLEKLAAACAAEDGRPSMYPEGHARFVLRVCEAAELTVIDAAADTTIERAARALSRVLTAIVEDIQAMARVDRDPS